MFLLDSGTNKSSWYYERLKIDIFYTACLDILKCMPIFNVVGNLQIRPPTDLLLQITRHPISTAI